MELLSFADLHIIGTKGFWNISIMFPVERAWNFKYLTQIRSLLKECLKTLTLNWRKNYISMTKP